MHPEVESNDVHFWFHRSDDVGLWETPTAIQWPDDPRVPHIHCGEFKEGVTPGGNKSSSHFINLSNQPGCNEDMPWGDRSFMIHDPEDNSITFFSRQTHDET